MIDRKEVIEALEYLISGECTDNQFDYLDEIEEAIALLKADQAELIRQRDTISKYRKADEFLALHGWKW